MSLFAQLARRKVFKVGAAYLVVAWLAVQAASIGFPALDKYGAADGCCRESTDYACQPRMTIVLVPFASPGMES